MIIFSLPSCNTGKHEERSSGYNAVMTRLRSFKALLFDADGTLYDSTPLHLEAYRQVSRELYDVDFTEEMYIEKVVRQYKKPPQVLREMGIPSNDEEFYGKKNACYRKLAQEKLRAVPGAPELLSFAKDHFIPCGIVSGSKRTSIEDSLDILNLRSFFSCIVSYEDAGSRLKPDPFSFLLAAEKIGVTPSKCCAFEDAKSGIQSGKAAGMFCVGIRNGANITEDLGDANIILDDFRALRYECGVGNLILHENLQLPSMRDIRGQ